MKNFDIRNESLFLKEIESHDVIIPLAATVGAPAYIDLSPHLATEVNLNQIKFIVDETSTDQKIVLPTTNSGGIVLTINFG